MEKIRSVLGWFTGLRLVIALALAAAIPATLFVISYRSRGAQIEQLTEDLQAAQGEAQLLREARQADARATSVAGSLRATATRKETKDRDRLEAALAASPAWADQPIPADVAASLRE